MPYLYLIKPCISSQHQTLNQPQNLTTIVLIQYFGMYFLMSYLDAVFVDTKNLNRNYSTSFLAHGTFYWGR